MSHPGATDRTDHKSAPVRPAEHQTHGGGDWGTKPSGWWAWQVTREDLSRKPEMVKLFQAAVDAGLLVNDLTSQVRFLALVHTAKAKDLNNLTGYLVKTIERGDWNYLTRESVDRAYRDVRPQGPPMSSEQKDLIRSPQSASQAYS